MINDKNGFLAETEQGNVSPLHFALTITHRCFHLFLDGLNFNFSLICHDCACNEGFIDNTLKIIKLHPDRRAEMRHEAVEQSKCFHMDNFLNKFRVMVHPQLLNVPHNDNTCTAIHFIYIRFMKYIVLIISTSAQIICIV